MRRIAIAALALVGSAASAMEVDTGFGVGVEYSDNIALARAGAEEDAWIGTGSALFRLMDRSAGGRYTVLGNAQYRSYQRGPFTNEVVFSLRADGSVTLQPAVSEWRIEDYFDQTVVNVFVPGTPSNRQDTNAFSTGPEARWDLSASQSLSAGARYSDFYFERSDTDSHRLAAFAGWHREMNSRRELSLHGRLASTDFASASYHDYRRGDIFVRLEQQWARASGEIDAGTTLIRRDGFEDVRGFLGRVGWHFYPNSFSGFEASVANEYTDAGQDILQAELHEGVVGPAELQVTGDIYYSRRASLAYHWDGTRTHWIIGAEGRDDDYQTTPNDLRYREGRIGVGYDLTPTLRASLHGIHRRADSFLLGQVFTDRVADLFFDYRINTRSSGALHLTHTERESNTAGSEFKENHLLLTFNYGLGSGLYGGLGLEALTERE